MQDSNINTAIDNRRVYNLVAYFFFLNVSIMEKISTVGSFKDPSNGELHSSVEIATILLTEFSIDNEKLRVISIACKTSYFFACMIFLKCCIPNFDQP